MKKLLCLLITPILFSGCMKQESSSKKLSNNLEVGCYVTHKSSMVNKGRPMEILELKYISTITYNNNSSYPKGHKHNKGTFTKYSGQVRTKNQWYYISAMKSYQCDIEGKSVKLN